MYNTCYALHLVFFLKGMVQSTTLNPGLWSHASVHMSMCRQIRHVYQANYGIAGPQNDALMLFVNQNNSLLRVFSESQSTDGSSSFRGNGSRYLCHHCHPPLWVTDDPVSSPQLMVNWL